MERISNRALSIAPSLTLSVTAKAGQLRAQGVDIISLSAGEPDFQTPEVIARAGIQAIETGNTKYTAAQGTVELREAIANRIKRDTGVVYSAEQITVANGAKHSLLNALLAIINPMDEVLIPTPYWVSYTEMVKLAGGVPVLVPTREEDGFCTNARQLESFRTEKTRAIILNSPSNPTGFVYSKELLREIGEWAVSHGLYIISDEIYSKLLYEGEHFSVAATKCDVYNITIMINGCSKAYAMTGWRIGYAAGPADVIGAMNKLQSQMTSNPSSIAQAASVVAMDSDDALIQPMIEAFRQRRDYCVDRINQMRGVRCSRPAGAFYLFVHSSDLYDRQYQGKRIKDSIGFSEFLLQEAQIAVVPGIGFGDDDYIRISFATSMELLEKAMDRMENAIAKLLDENK